MVVFVLLTIYGIYDDAYLLHVIPVALTFLYLLLFKLDYVLLALNALIPLSVQVDDVGYGFGLSLPDEPVMMSIMLLSVLKFVIDGSYDIKALRHPISVVVFMTMGWYFVTAATSEMPMVSIKYAISQMWFMVVFYFLAIMLFKQMRYMLIYHWLYIIPLLLVVLYTFYEHGKFGFSQEASFYISRPFYIAHGIYSACIAFLVPFIVAWMYYYKKVNLHAGHLVILSGILLIFLLALFLSYTRAAWLSVLIAGLMLIPIALKIKFRNQLIILFTGVALFLFFKDDILYALSKNKQDSAEGFSKHLQSASNIRTDASNVERINRWMTALEMFKRKPVFGFGPGTYPFKYAPYQLARYKTVITTNFGNQGNAHSEFLNPLAEQGLLGAINIILIVFYGLNTAFNMLFTEKDKRLKMLLFANALGLVTYFTHGLLNNYMDSSKVAPLVWGGLAMIVAIDIFHKTSDKKAEIDLSVSSNQQV